MIEDFDTVDEKIVTLDTIVRCEKFKFIYEYDFGDGWEHELLVEKILPIEEGKTYRANEPVHLRIVEAYGATAIF